ncbi:hypothetical protein AS026_02150 [Rhizobium altiplani]|uniref:Uncharacterized protein n=2 Tax=Rhizobium altiplani TaxID=1864509 RepID=A0A125QAC6_9HYPH|nr:hypothetical protein AS026_02150 [Rhizobium altiplani]
MLFKWCINVSRVRTLMRGADFDSLRASGEAVTRSVIDRRIERRRPSGNRTTTNAAPRPDWTDTSSRR